MVRSLSRATLVGSFVDRVLDAYCPEVPGYYLYYPSRLNLAPKLKVLIDFLKENDDPRRATR